MEAGLRAVMSHPGLQTIRSSAVVAHAGLVDVVCIGLPSWVTQCQVRAVGAYQKVSFTSGIADATTQRE